MAGSARSATAKHAYRMFAPSRGGAARCPGSPGGGAGDEFDESDVWGSFGVDSSPAEIGARGRPIPSAVRAGRKAPQLDRAAGAAPGSLPVNIPDWQKILGVEYRDHLQAAAEWGLHNDDDDEDDYEYGKVAGLGGTMVIPPHELAWRSRAASLSVHEGIGRTLKGRDLSRVRDAVWKKTGFED
ncbi:hypothetical protein GUJ93_ZPchr0014g47176 [Zizania palustris]|uniref:Senescence regulator n=1 Tax=Zizania palustris TaxID=103762 RepID=A0A8J5SX40_ZIZPA|nr:hypothetical protein GUJ93_ZPchr0014g47176 [Zizania palustris]